MRITIRYNPGFIKICWTLLAVTTIFFFCSISYADTTWVVGDVYGVWDTSGSPFMVTDTITVPLDSTLEIRPGVEIWFLDQEIRRTPILVHGRLHAIGEEGDSIYFYSLGSGFGGINNGMTPETEIHLEYCVVDSLYDEIFSYQGTLTILHSFIKIRRWGNAIYSYSDVVNIQYSYFKDAIINFLYEEGIVVFRHNRGTRYTQFNAIASQMATFFDNHLGDAHFDECGAVEIYDNSLRRGSSSQSGFTYWHDNFIEDGYSASVGVTTFEHNQVGYIHADGMSGVIRDNEIYGTTVHATIELYSTEMTFEKNLVLSGSDGIQISFGGSNVIQGNTIIFDDYGIDAFAVAESQHFIDNIFVGDGVNATGIYFTSPNSSIVRYNDFHNVTAATYNCELDTGNIFWDPLFCSGYPYDYHLQSNSPCIDAGDPSLPLDPDGTRADIGCYYFDQLIDQPPALVSPVTVNVQRGQILRYEARATDDHGPLRFGFWDVPGWLHRIYPQIDYEEGIAMLSGRVPNQQQDFTFGVWVEDGLAQRDSQEVEVSISSYTILAGEVTGMLTVEDSPYMVVEDVIVPAGDSLCIEPGVEIRFQWHPLEDLRRRIVVRGKLHAVGTPEDTIRFIPEFGDSLLEAWRGILCVGSILDTSKFDYTYFANALYGVVADSQGAVVIKHSCLDNIGRGIWIIHNSWAAVDSCEFCEYIPNYSTFVSVNEASATITNCRSVYLEATEHGSHLSFSHGSHGTVQGCTFIKGRSCYFDHSSFGEFIGNIVQQLGYGIGFYNGSSGIVANNVVSSGGGALLGSADSVLVSNNCFYHTETGVQISFLPTEVYVKNNIFLENHCGVRFLFGPGLFSDLTYNDFFRNDSNMVNCEGDSTNIFLDPMFQDTINFHLSLGSPCIDAGDPDPFFNDPDSTRNDIGCWGGPWGESYQYPTFFANFDKTIPLDFSLLPPYPNPFNSILVIPFTIPTQSEIKITIYNILGQRIDQFDFPPLSPGVHRIIWNPTSCASGLYIIQLTSSDKEFNQKALLIK